MSKLGTMFDNVVPLTPEQTQGILNRLEIAQEDVLKTGRDVAQMSPGSPPETMFAYGFLAALEFVEIYINGVESDLLKAGQDA